MKRNLLTRNHDRIPRRRLRQQQGASCPLATNNLNPMMNQSDREYWQRRIYELRHPSTTRSLKPDLTIEDLAEVILAMSDRMAELEKRIRELERS